MDFYIPGDSRDCCAHFDYYLPHQELTIVTVFGLDPLNPFAWGTHFSGTADSDSTFSVILVAANNTGVAWTSSVLRCNPFIVGDWGVIIPESVQSTRLETITFPGTWTVEFSGPPPVLNGEFFVIEFDMYVDSGGFKNYLELTVVPEPATVLLVGVGGLALRRKRRSLR